MFHNNSERFFANQIAKYIFFQTGFVAIGSLFHIVLIINLQFSILTLLRN